MNTVLLEARPYRPFKSSEEYLYAMREDLAEWLNTLYPELCINVDNFMDRLDTGVALCKHANNVRAAAEEYLARRQARQKSMTKSITTGLAGPILAMGSVHYLSMAKSGTFFARDNVSNFIAWCRKSLHIFECLLFETDDLIMRKNEKHVILCLLEVARRGAKFGMLAPMLVQMERQIDREIAADNKAMGISVGCGTDNENGVNSISVGTDGNDLFESDSEDEEEDSNPMLIYGPQPQIITNDLKSLDEMVRDLVEKCTCPSQFPMVRVSEGKYRIGDTKVLIFVRILRSHVMVRVGGGWDTLAHYLDKHDPCRCRSQHRSSFAAKLITKTNNSNGIELHKAQVIYERSPPPTRKQSLGQNQQPTHNNISSPSNGLTNNLSPPSRQKSRSRSPNQKTVELNNKLHNEKLTSSPYLTRRSASPNTRCTPNEFKKKQYSLDSNSSVEPLSSIENNNNNNNNTTINSKISETNVEISGKSDNISDNGSEISDEGYRSLGIIQTNNKRSSLHSEASNDDNEMNGKIENETPTTITSTESPGSDLSSKVNELSSPDLIDAGSNPSDDCNEPKVTFEQSGITITDDEITVDIASSTGLRKTGFSNQLYDGDNPTCIDGVNISTSPSNLNGTKKTLSKIPKSPLPVRRKSVDSSNTSDDIVTGLPLNRKSPVYRSIKRPTPNSVSTPNIQNIKKDGTSTWNGRSTNKTRPTISTNTYQSPNSTLNNNFNRNTPIRSSTSNLYDKNGRKIKSSSVTTSPVKKSTTPQQSQCTSPLAKEILEVAGNYKNDTQILEKMKDILNKYSNKYKLPEKDNQQSSPIRLNTNKNTEQEIVFDDFTTAWVNNSGTIDMKDTNMSTKSGESKRSSIVSTDSSNSKDIPNIMAQRKDRRGCSRIPAPVK